ncbi:transposase [uncultured Corynebacterium sp.]|uniref:transposase n=1 Tax=Corynebacterium TaxID=1716 RepID=UPI0009E9DBEC
MIGECRRLFGISRPESFREIPEATWEIIAPLLPSTAGKVDRSFSANRTIMEAIVYRFRVGCPWRDLSERFGPWQAVWKRHTLYSRTGVYDAIYQHVMALKDAEGDIDWALSVDGTMSRAHQHATKTPRPDQHTRGSYTLQEFLATE